MAIQDICEAVTGYKIAKTVEATKQVIDSGIDPSEILREGLVAPLDEVGKRFSAGELFVPEMLVAAKAVQAGLDILKPLLANTDFKPAGHVVQGAVKGDLHDIGKNIVAMMLEGAGFNVSDIGVDADAKRFLDTAEKNGADIIALSALLTTTMESMEEIVSQLKAAGIKGRIIVGGAPVTREFCEKIGADGDAEDAGGAVLLSRQLL
jgi:5-methyltetrahydrofolate--homocysteine methyltransferase